MVETADIVVIGAGIAGLNIAFQLARRSDATIVALEKGDGPGEGSTGASSAVCRFKYSRDEMVALAASGIGAYRHWRDYTGLSAPRVRYHRQGMLWLTGEDTARAEGEAARLSALGVSVELLGVADVHERFPALSLCLLAPDLEIGEPHVCGEGGTHLFEPDAGYVDPVDALQDLVDACRQAGVDVRFRSAVAAIDVGNGRVRGVRLVDGGSIACGAMVNAAGPWCNALTESAGLTSAWPLRPTRIQVVHIDRSPEIAGEIPVTCDVPGGIYFRTQNGGRQIIVGSILEEDEREEVSDPDDFARYIDDDFGRRKLHALQHRIPALSYRGVRGYSGLYTVNRSDMHPIVGESELAGLFLANGFSGHGFKIAPAIGALLAREISGTALAGDPEVGADFLSPGRRPITDASRSVLA